MLTRLELDVSQWLQKHEEDCGWQCLVPAIMYFKVYCLAPGQPFRRAAASKVQEDDAQMEWLWHHGSLQWKVSFC